MIAAAPGWLIGATVTAGLTAALVLVLAIADPIIRPFLEEPPVKNVPAPHRGGPMSSITEKARIEQIAEAIEAADAATFGYEPGRADDGYLTIARAVLPVVKTVQREAAQQALRGLADQEAQNAERRRCKDDRRGYGLCRHAKHAADDYRMTHYPEKETTP